MSEFLTEIKKVPMRYKIGILLLWAFAIAYNIAWIWWLKS